MRNDRIAALRAVPRENFSLISTGSGVRTFLYASLKPLDGLLEPHHFDFAREAGAQVGDMVVAFYGAGTGNPGVAFLTITGATKLTHGQSGVSVSQLPVAQPQVQAKKTKAA